MICILYWIEESPRFGKYRFSSGGLRGPLNKYSRTLQAPAIFKYLVCDYSVRLYVSVFLI